MSRVFIMLKLDTIQKNKIHWRRKRDRTSRSSHSQLKKPWVWFNWETLWWEWEGSVTVSFQSFPIHTICIHVNGSKLNWEKLLIHHLITKIVFLLQLIIHQNNFLPFSWDAFTDQMTDYGSPIVCFNFLYNWEILEVTFVYYI